jgi:hypothetical protein
METVSEQPKVIPETKLLHVTCDICKGEFDFSFDMLQITTVEKDNPGYGWKKKYIVRFYKCPQCNTNFVFMIEDEQFIRTKAEYLGYVQKIGLRKQTGEKVSKTLMKRMEESKASMDKQHKKLSFEFPKTFYQFSELINWVPNEDGTGTLQTGLN